ncbi:MAG: hypothetical protein PW999_00860 [Paraburkholderia tropica]|uniref:hypothetical protein n=1 Tax=Paraburkholderia bannensis TaxID=765414 RepID=UPI0005AB07B3|nr:hypothetical protein [Paraburkholderia bannensis]MDE1138210.1 hypothetical protein [Paraburkholderia tropica]
MSQGQNAANNPASWLVSIKTVIAIIAGVLSILTALVGASAWCIGLYSGLSNRVTVLEQSNQAMRDDLKDIKGMVLQLVSNSAANRPDTRRWTK